MTAPSRREQNRLEKQARILDAALQVFARAGYSGASMDAIAAEAEVTKPTVYHYFPSKDDLFNAMMADRKDQMLMAFAADAAGNIVTQLHSFAWRYARSVMRPEMLSLTRLVIGEARRFPDIGRQYQASGPERLVAGLADYLSSCRDTGQLQFEDAEMAAHDLLSLVLSTPRNAALHEPDLRFEEGDLSRHIQNGLMVFLRAYATQPEYQLNRLAEVVTNADSSGIQ
ncbi:MAG: TetR/AcrR family transcriptional regulator [Paracoccaceae bacterium]